MKSIVIFGIGSCYVLKSFDDVPENAEQVEEYEGDYIIFKSLNLNGKLVNYAVEA